MPTASSVSAVSGIMEGESSAVPSVRTSYVRMISLSTRQAARFFKQKHSNVFPVINWDNTPVCGVRLVTVMITLRVKSSNRRKEKVLRVPNVVTRHRRPKI